MNLVSQADFAKLKSVSRATVTKWKQRGRLTMVGDMVDAEASQARLVQGAGYFAAGQRRPLATLPAVAGADVPGPVKSLAIMAQGTGLDAAEAVLRSGGDADLARAVANWITVKAIQAASDLSDFDFEPPPGFKRWASHPVFAETPSYLEASTWAEMIADIAAHPEG
jgi:hypothetical protein